MRIFNTKIINKNVSIKYANSTDLCLSVIGIIVKSYIILWAAVGRTASIIKNKHYIENKIARLISNSCWYTTKAGVHLLLFTLPQKHSPQETHIKYHRTSK